MFSCTRLSLKGASVIRNSVNGLKSMNDLNFVKKGLKPPPSFKHIRMPPEENRKLVAFEPVPHWPNNVTPIKLQKQLHDMRGPETVHNTLMYHQFGIIALGGGQLKPSHFHMIIQTINRAMDTQKMFAVWRVDPPWKPVTRRGIGKRMGGGKGSISFYCTPVKAGRIILELGGRIEYRECQPILEDVVNKLPFHAMAITEDLMEDLKRKYETIKKENINPISFERLVYYNMQGCNSLLGPYDRMWAGKYI